jgi:hypothetical protein
MERSIRIKYENKEFDVEFWHQPEEKQTRDYPGCPESIDLTSVVNGIELLPAIKILNLESMFRLLVWDAIE